MAAILLMTPPAMVIAVGTCCTAEYYLPDAVGMAVMIGGPFLVLYGLMAWAAVLDRPRNSHSSEKSRRGNFLLKIPFIVAGASIVGLLPAAVAASGVWSYQGAGLTDAGIELGTAVLWAVSGTTLLVLLFIAWRSR